MYRFAFSTSYLFIYLFICFCFFRFSATFAKDNDDFVCTASVRKENEKIELFLNILDLARVNGQLKNQL